jgi:hypothetical protein
MRWIWHVAYIGEGRNAYKILIGKLEEKRSTKRPRHKWENIIKLNLKEMIRQYVDLFHLTRIGTIGGLLRTQ